MSAQSVLGIPDTIDSNKPAATEGARVTKATERLQVEPTHVGVPGATVFPATYASPKPPPLQEKISLLRQIPGVDGRFVVNVPVTDEDAQVMKDKNAMSRLRDFDEWVTGQYNLNDPAQLNLIQSIYPQYFDARRKQIEADAQLLAKMQEMRLYGPKSLEDLMLLKEVQTNGQLRERLSGKKWSAVTMGTLSNADVATETQRFQRGMFNPNSMNRIIAGGTISEQGEDAAVARNLINTVPAPDQFPGLIPNRLSFYQQPTQQAGSQL